MPDERAGPLSAMNQDEVIAFLERPDSYGELERVERIDTHAAIVFLAGDCAYKLKRAVKFPYLDFSSPAKRKAVCEAELTLNRRTAPELYLGVRSINRLANGKLGFSQGEPIDWLVVMRRFKSTDLLEDVASRGGLDAALTVSLADEIARFHDLAETIPSERGAERVSRVIESNFESMIRLAPGIIDAGACQNLFQASLAECGRVRDLLDRRAASGHVRLCHGDLHLANICLWQGKPTLFDCLEFDPELAKSDVLYDVAFLVMDLWQRDYRPSANLLFNRYLDRREEADGLGAVPLFLSMRAAIRAHVSGAAAERQAEVKDQEQKVADARHYLDAAQAFLKLSKPQLIVIAGLSGTGKSTLARALAPLVGAAPGARWLRTDVLRKRLAGLSPETRLPKDAYTPERSAEVYASLQKEAADAIEAGSTVIVDGVFAKPEERAEIAQIAATARAEFTGLWLTAPPETMLERVGTRILDASDADEAVVEHQLSYDLGSLAGWLRIDAGRTPEAVLSSSIGLLQSRLNRSSGN